MSRFIGRRPAELALAIFALSTFLVVLSGCRPSTKHADLLITNGMIYDGSGGEPYRGAVAVAEGRIVAIGQVNGYVATRTADAGGLAVSPGFINMLSWADESLIHDGRGMSDVKQGVTLEIFGEGESLGPLTPEMKAETKKWQTDIRYEIEWTTLGEALDFLTKRGVSMNVGSFLGAGTIRSYEIGFTNRAPTDEELARMQELVRQGMREGALGIGSALVYTPGTFAKTDELIALTKAAGEFGGGYISHIRSDAGDMLEALDELFAIARAANVHAEVHHLKASGQKNWPLMQEAIDRIEAARREGLAITANMYPYTASASGLDASMPPWVREGGLDAWVARMKDPMIRKRLLKELQEGGEGFEGTFKRAGGPEGVLLLGFKNEKLKPYTGKSLAEVSKMRGTSPEDTMIDLVIEDGSRVATAYFVMSEENVKLGLSQPWVSIDSDEASPAPEGVFLLSKPHPRAYGSFARFLGKYVREEKVTTLPDAIRRLTRMPAENFKLKDRGCIDVGCHADIVVFDPDTIADHATLAEPHRYATGVAHVFVNGTQVIKDGEHTGAKPGQVVRGPGWTGWKDAAP